MLGIEKLISGECQSECLVNLDLKIMLERDGPWMTPSGDTERAHVQSDYSNVG
jgi:hypothetical protein